VLEVDLDVAEPVQLVPAYPSHHARGDASLLVDEEETGELDRHEGLDPLEQLARDRLSILRAGERRRDRGHRLEVTAGDGGAGRPSTAAENQRGRDGEEGRPRKGRPDAAGRCILLDGQKDPVGGRSDGDRREDRELRLKALALPNQTRCRSQICTRDDEQRHGVEPQDLIRL